MRESTFTIHSESHERVYFSYLILTLIFIDVTYYVYEYSILPCSTS